MKNNIETVSRQLEYIFVIFFKYLFRMDQSKIEKGIGRNHLELLNALSIAEEDGEIISLSKIAKRLLISKAYTTALTNKLVKEGLIKRQYDKKDRRVIKIVLTQTGRTVLKERLDDNIQNYKKRLSNLSKENIETLSKSLENIKKILSKIKIDDF